MKSSHPLSCFPNRTCEILRRLCSLSLAISASSRCSWCSFNNFDRSRDSSIVSIGEALVHSVVHSLNESLGSHSFSLSWVRDSSKRCFLLRGASVVLSTGGLRFRGEVRQGNLEGQASSHNVIFVPPVPFFTWLGRKCKEYTFVAFVSLKCGPTSRCILTSHSCGRFWSFGKPKSPTLFPSGSTVPFCVQPGTQQ